MPMPIPWRLVFTPRCTIFSLTKEPLWQVPVRPEPRIPQRELVDEEIHPEYRPSSFYPARPGEVLARKFQLLVKIGWGSQSTVWLARDVSRCPSTLSVRVCFMLTAETNPVRFSLSPLRNKGLDGNPKK